MVKLQAHFSMFKHFLHQIQVNKIYTTNSHNSVGLCKYNNPSMLLIGSYTIVVFS